MVVEVEQSGSALPELAAAPVASRPPDGWSGAARGFGWALLLCWAAVLGCVVLMGSHPSSLEALRADLRAGDVEAVQVTGGLSEGGLGYASVQLEWRTGLLHHHATAIEATPGQSHRAAQRQAPDATVVDPGLRERLAELDPGVPVQELRTSASHGDILGWRTPFPMFWAFLGLWIATWALLHLGPPPRRATRAAWGWLIFLAPPFGIPGYLLLGGPTGLVPRPRVGRRGLTGGWAFLLALLLSGAYAAG